MRISGPQNIGSGTARKAEKKRSERGSTEFTSDVGTASATDNSQASRSAVGAAPIAALDALLSVQETPDTLEGRSKGIVRAEEMLDLLEHVRRGILLGSIPLRNLQALAKMARQQGTRQEDERLRHVLGDIELRAEVELAKYGF